MPHPAAIYWRTGWLIAVGVAVSPLLLWFIRGNGLQWPLEGIVLGTVFTQTMVAAAWATWGPGGLYIRLPLSLAWAVLMGASLTVGVVLNHGRPDTGIFVVATAALWLTAQVPLWGTALFFGLRLWHQGTPLDEASFRRQFGIKQLMLFTTFIAVLLGICRLLLSNLKFKPTDNDELTFWGFMIVSQIATNLPLMCATMLPRHKWPGIGIGLLLIAGITWLEYAFTPKLMPFPPGYLIILLVVTNLTNALWILAFAAVVRRSGYHFGIPSMDSELAQVAPK